MAVIGDKSRVLRPQSSIGRVAPGWEPWWFKPYLSVPFTEGGGVPRDLLGIRPGVITGAPTWGAHLAGRYLHFPNTVPGTPTDWVDYAHQPGISSVTVVPHTIGLLFRSTSFASNGYVFVTETSGNGVIFAGSGAGLQVVHGGVIAFTTLGTVTDGHWMFSGYSFDKVTMRQVLRDCSTGQVFQQAIANTSAISTTGSTNPRIGEKGTGEVFQGDVALVHWFGGALAMHELLAWANAPYAFLQRRQRAKSPAIVAAGGGGGNRFLVRRRRDAEDS